jgi:hypothetical protein
MLAEKDIRLAQEGIATLHAQGKDEQARALEAVLELATSIRAEQQPPRPRDYLTIAQAARALGGMSRRTIKEWIETGEIQTLVANGQTLLRRDSLFDFVNRHRAHHAPPQPLTPGEQQLEEQRRDFIMAGIPADKLSRLEALHDRMEDGEQLSRQARSEMVALEREVTQAATNRLKEWLELRGIRVS